MIRLKEVVSHEHAGESDCGDDLEIPTTEKAGMLVPARIYATEQLFNAMDETVYDQITNVATLPGITKYAMCMPDGHSGYGFPIGGVAAMDVEPAG